jgi:hypothetical protein
MNVSLISYGRPKASAEQSIGNGEVDSSILSGSPSFSNKIGIFFERFRSHFSHNAPAMHLHGYFGNSDFSRDMFVHASGNDQSHHVLLPGAQGRKKSLQARQGLCIITAPSVAFDCRRHRVQYS